MPRQEDCGDRVKGDTMEGRGWLPLSLGKDSLSPTPPTTDMADDLGETILNRLPKAVGSVTTLP